MPPFRHVSTLSVLPIWAGIEARCVQGQEMTFAIVDLGSNAVVDQHQHPNEQMGVVLRGSLQFTIGAETQLLQVGDTYVVPGGVPHHVVAGPEGAVVVDVFSPVRADWNRFDPEPARKGTWPEDKG